MKKLEILKKMKVSSEHDNFIGFLCFLSASLAGYLLTNYIHLLGL